MSSIGSSLAVLYASLRVRTVMLIHAVLCVSSSFLDEMVLVSIVVVATV